jgi:hypothetical protein
MKLSPFTILLFSSSHFKIKNLNQIREKNYAFLRKTFKFQVELYTPKRKIIHF